MKDLSVRLPVEHSERAMLNNPDVYDLSTARRDSSSKGKYGHKVGGRLQADLLDDRTPKDGVVVEQDSSARNTKDRYFGQKPRGRRPADPFANTRREMKDYQRQAAQTQKRIELLQQKKTMLERKKEKLAFDKKQLPMEDINAMNDINMRIQALKQGDTDGKLYGKKFGRNKDEAFQGLTSLEAKVKENEDFLKPENNYLEGQYVDEKAAHKKVNPQWQKKLQTSKLGGARIRGGQKPSVQPYGSPRGRNKVNNPRPKGFIQQWQDQLRGGN